MKTSANDSGSNFAALIELQELSSRLMAQIESAHREIGETRAILKDAIDRLMPAFTAMRATDAQQVMSPSKREAFSALQFQDISDQLLAHAQARLSSLQAAVYQLSKAMENGDVHPGDTDTLYALVEQANDQLADLDLNLIKPVGKAHLGTGDMELF